MAVRVIGVARVVQLVGAVVVCVLVGGLVAGTVVAQGTRQGAWLDGTLEPWNAPGRAVPRSALMTSFAPTQCLRLERPGVNAEETDVLRAGWKLVTMWPTERRGEIAVVMATSDHDGMCRPIGFNAFVFVGGRFAGTASPEPMGSRADGTLIRPPAFLPDGRLDASFVRFAPGDPLCCPSRPQTRLLYRVEMTDAGPVLLAERPGAGRLRLPATGGWPGGEALAAWGESAAAGAAGASEACVCSTGEDSCWID